jgi:hypothetical protein|tara:strand:+ start:356 stop:568 length:213 start_codon:yes stop_codon:yes gene_type:complete
MACNCNKVDKKAIWLRYKAGINASRIAAQMMVQLSLVYECIAEGDPDAIPIVRTKAKAAKNKIAKDKLND